jgi:hypothetical protein
LSANSLWAGSLGLPPPCLPGPFAMDGPLS